MQNPKENSDSENTQKDSEETEQPHNNLTNRVEGQKALDRLFNELDAKGLLVDPEQESQSTIELLDRVVSLENEVDLLKDLVARALKVNTVEVLKD